MKCKENSLNDKNVKVSYDALKGTSYQLVEIVLLQYSLRVEFAKLTSLDLKVK